MKTDPRERRTDKRRKVERRHAKQGVTVRHDDPDNDEPRRVRWGKLTLEKEAKEKK